MPPSPSLRRSPGMEPRGDSHKRGRSLENGLSFKEKDDDLALFNEMQSRERENFLLQSTDDFEDILSSRVKPFQDFKLGINIPARGASSDLLNADGDKNDYDWLLTPPDTPLFPSLDDEPALVNLVHNGRVRSRPISISRSSTMERSQRNSRGSPSPQRLSPSPRSGSGAFRGRPSSAPHSSPVPLRPGTPSRRPSPPPVKPSTPPPRSSSPASQRLTAGSGGSVVTSGLRGTSPVRMSRGNSSSPKIRAWQSNIPGFSLEAPPNLRTSLADRPASYVRGSSLASRTSRDSSTKVRRQSMSPTASRSISSSHSQDRDRLSSHSKGSLASSGDDDVDSLQSVPLSVSERPMSRKGVSGFPGSRPAGFSKKPTKTFSPSSAPKRSFDSAMRQVERKSPQNMFRPLLSSVPSSTFYAGKSSSAHRSMMSRTSSVTTSSNASSDQATGGAHDTEGSDQYQDDMASECTRLPFSDIQDEVFAVDKMDITNEGTGPEARDAFCSVQLGEPDRSSSLAYNPGVSEESSLPDRARATTATSEATVMQGDSIEIDSHENSLLCSRCGGEYHANELAESESNLCPECKKKEELLANTAVSLMDVSEELNVRERNLAVLQLENATDTADSRNILRAAIHVENTLKTSGQVQMLPEQQVTEERKTADMSSSNIAAADGAGVSVLLLRRSSSLKGPLIHGRSINSSAISYDDLSYARDLGSSLRSSIGHGSVSTSSSIDLASSRHSEMLVEQQLSGRRSDTSSKPQSTFLFFSGTSLPVCQGFGLSTSSHEENGEGSTSNTRHILAEETLGSASGQGVPLEAGVSCDTVTSGSRLALSEEDSNEICVGSRGKDADLVAGHTLSSELDDTCQASIMDEGHALCEIDEDSQKEKESVRNVEGSVIVESSLAAESSTNPDNRVDQMVVEEDTRQGLATMSEIEIDDSHPSSPRSQIDTVSRDGVEEASGAMHPDDVKDSSIESSEPEESTVMVENQGCRSLTLEEATDTILFCSSIVHELAYKAATIAIEKEKENLEPLEGSRPQVTIPEKRSSDRRGTGRAAKAQKARKKCPEPESRPPLTITEEKSDEPVVRNVGIPSNGDSMKPPKLESKCNCTIM